MAAISDAIRAAVLEAQQSKGRVLAGDWDQANEARTRMNDALNVTVMQALDNSFPQQLARHIQTVLPQIMNSLDLSQTNSHYTDEERTNINNSIDQALSALTELVQSEAFDKDLTNDTSILQELNTQITSLQTAITTNLQSERSHHYTDFANDLEVSAGNIRTSGQEVQGRIDQINKENAEPEDISLNTKGLKKQLEESRNDIKEFRNSLDSLFNFHTNFDLSTAAKVFEDINKSAMSADEAIQTLHNTVIGQKLDSPESVSGAKQSADNLRQILEQITQQAADTTASIAQVSLGDVTKFYNNLLRLGSDHNISLSQLRASINNLQISDSDRAELETALQSSEDQLEALVDTAHSEFTTAFNKRIDSIIQTIERGEQRALTQFAQGRGLGAKYTSALRQSGEAASSIWQIATGIEQTKDRFSLLGFGFGGGKNLHGIKRDASIISQTQFELGNASENLAGLFDQAAEQSRRGDHAASANTKRNAEKLFATIVHMQSDISARTIRAAKEWNSLSEKERKRLDPEGQMENKIRQAKEAAKQGNLAILQMKEAYNIEVDSDTKKQLKQLRGDTKDLAKIDKEAKKATNKTESAMNSISNFARTAYNEIRSIISSIRQLFNTFGVGAALMGPIETSTKLYEYHRKQGQARFAAMGTDAYIGYTDLDDSRERAHARLMAGNELYRMSGGRIDREVIDKQYQSLLRNVGGQYGSTPEQAVADAEFLTKHTALFKNVYGIDDSTMQQAIKTYYKDMEMSPQETIDALATLSAQAQAANIPLGQYLSKVSSITQTFMQIGISGEQAHIILNQLLQSGVRMEVAEEIASQVGSAAGKFAEDKNKIAFAAVMQGENPWHAMALATYTHTADGKPRDGWAREIGGRMDTYLNTVMMAYGNDPNMRRIGATDLLKGMGLNQRAASRMASVYLEEGNSEMFQQLLGEEMSKADNPNAKMEELSTKIHEQLIEMTGQLAESDRTIAELDSNLYREARAIGSNMDIILNELAPIIIEFQKQMLKFIMEALKFIQKLVTSDLFKEISNTIVETIRGIPDFLVDVERKIDSALGWIQSLIEGTGDKGAQQAAGELGKDSQPDGVAGGMLGYGVGTVAGLITPGPAPFKIAVGAGTTYLFNKLLRMIQNAATEKDANGNLVKDVNGNPKFKDSMFGNVMSWMSSSERLWNNANHPIAGITATMAAPAVFKSLGNINALSLTTEGIGGGARLLRGGARGLAAGLVSYLVYNIMGSGPSQGTTNVQSDTNKQVLGVSETLNQDVLGLTTIGTVASNTVTFGAIQRLISKIASPASSLRGLRPRAAIGMLGVLGVNALTDYLFDKDTTTTKLTAKSQETTATVNEPSKQKVDKDKSYFETFLDLISSKSEAAELPANYDATNPVESATAEAITANKPSSSSSSSTTTSQSSKRKKEQEEEKQREDSISALTVLSSAAAATGAGVFALMLKNFVTHEELIPLIKNIASLFKAPIKDIFNILKNTWGVIKDISKSIAASISNFGSTVRATPGTFKTKFGASTVGRWRLINKQYDYEKEIKRLTTERERLIKQIQNPNRLTRVDRITKDLERVENALGRTTRAHSRVTEILESSKGLKWLPNRQELANIRRAENLLNASGRPGDVFRSSLKDIQNLDKESIQLSRKLARTERELANIMARINNPDFKFMRSADITRQIELIAEQRNLKFDIKDLATRRKGIDGIEMYRAAMRQASGLGHGIVVNDIETFIKTHGAINANELKRARLVADAQALEAKILDRQTRMRGLNPNSQEFTRLERELKNIRTVANNRNKAIKALDVKIQKLKINLGAQIKASTSTFNRITHNAFSESKRLINEISKGTKDLLKSVFDKTKKSIFDIAKSALQTIGKVLGSQATNFLKSIGQRASALIEPFKKIFDGLKVLGKFLGLTDAAISGGAAAETSILGKLKNAAKSAGKALLRIPGVKFMAELAKGAGEKVLNIGGRALKFMGKVAMPLAFASIFYDIYSYEQQSGNISYAVEHAFRDNAAELALLGIALTGPVGAGIAGATAAIDILWRVATGHGALEELGQVTGLSIKATDEDKRKELVGILTQKYPELNDHPELIEKIVKKEISLDQALAFIAGGGGSGELLAGDASLSDDGSIPDVNKTIAGLSDQTQNQIMADIAAGTQDIQKLQEKYNLTDDQAAAVSQIVGLTPADKVPDNVSLTPPGQILGEEISTVPGYVPDNTTDIDDKEEDENSDSNSDNSGLTKEQRRQQRREQRQAKNVLRRQHNDPLAEAQRIAGLTNNQVSKEKQQEFIESLITEHASRVEKDYKDMSKKIEDSSLTAEKKLEVKSALETKHQHDLEQIESLRGKADTDEIKQLLGQVQNDYAKTNKNIELQSGITYATLPERRDQRYIPMDIARRQYADPLFEASRIAGLTDKQISKDRRKQLLGGLFDEHEQRVERDYQEMSGKINQSRLSEEKKQEAKALLDAKHEKDLQHIKQLREETDNNNISALSEQVQDAYRKSSQAVEVSIGINYEELPETREEADNSRKFHTTRATRQINEKQLESQRLQEITNATLEDFMDSHEKLMSMFQQTVTREHENIFKMIGITHQILMDLKQTFVRSGALIFAATVKGITSPGGGTIPNQAPAPPQGTDDSAVAARRLTVFNHLSGANFSENAIAGILGNLHRESYGFDPTADNRTHHGIAQWDKNDRWPRIKQWIESHGGKADDLDWQVKAMLWEMKEVYGITPESFKPASIEEAVDYINKHYEVSGEGISERLNFANQDIAAVKQAKQPASIGGARAAGVFDIANGQPQGSRLSASGHILPIYNQGDVTEGNLSASVACTPTAVAMMATAYTGRTITPNEVNKDYYSLAASLQQHGVASKEVEIHSAQDVKLIEDKLRQNNPVLFYYENAPTGNGLNMGRGSHAVVLAGFNSDGTVRVHDPNGGKVVNLPISQIVNSYSGHNIAYIPNANVPITSFGSGNGNNAMLAQFAPAWGLTDLPNDSSYQFFTNYVQVNSSMSPELTLAGIYAKEFNQRAEDHNAKIREAHKQQQSPPQSPPPPPQAVKGAVIELPGQQTPPTDPKVEAARIAIGEPLKSASDEKPTGDKQPATNGEKAQTVEKVQAGVKPVEKPKHVPFHNPFEDLVAKLIDINYTYNSDDSLYRERVFGETYSPQIIDQARKNKRFERPKIVAPQKPVEPQELSQEEIDKLTPEEKEKYEERIFNERLAYDQQLIEWKEYQKNKPGLWDILPSISDYDALTMANNQFKKQRLDRLSDEDLLKYFGIEVHDNINADEYTLNKDVKAIAKLIRAGKDLQGNKITEEQIQKLIDTGLNRDEALAKIYKNTNSFEFANFTGKVQHISELFNISHKPDFLERSKNLKRAHIKRKKQESSEAPVHVQGYERGQQVDFWTDEIGAETFYCNQLDLYKTANRFSYKDSAFYDKLFNEYKQNILKGEDRDLTPRERAQIEAEVGARMSTWAEFNMTGREYAQYMGYEINGDVSDKVYDELLLNAALGKSPNGKDYMEAIDQAKDEILKILDGSLKTTDEELEQIRSRLEGLEVSSTAYQDALIMLARQRVPRTKYEEFGEITDNMGSGGFGKTNHNYEALRDPEGRQSLYQSTAGMLPMALGTYMGGLWGEHSRSSYGGMTGYQFLKQLQMNPTDPNGPPLVNWDFDVATPFNKFVLEAREHFGKAMSGGKHKGPIYEVFWGSSHNANTLAINKRMAGLSTEAHDQARTDRRDQQFAGKLRQSYAKGNLEIHRAANQDGSTNYDITSRSGGHLTVNLRAGGITGAAMKGLVNAIQEYFKEHGDVAQLFEDLDIRSE